MPILYPASNRFKYARSASDFRARRYAIQNPPLFSPSLLFAAMEQGAWYDPSDLSTLFQDAAGTTPVTSVEQPVGLMLDKSRGLVLGPELVVNGDGSAGITGWTTTTWAVNVAGQFTASSGNLIQSGVVTVGRWYLVEWDQIGPLTNTLNVFCGVLSVHPFTLTSTAGRKSLRVQAIGSSQIIFQANGANTTIDNISVRELPGNHAFQTTATSRPVLSARYNLLTKTEDFSDSAWSKVAVTVTTNATTAPDGATTADKIVATNTASATRGVYESISPVSGVQYVIGFSVKASEYSKLCVAEIGGGRFGATFDLTAETTTSLGGAGFVSSSITATGNGWYRCVIVATAGSSEWAAAAVGYPTGAALSAAGCSYAGDGTSGVFIWGASIVPANQADLPYQRVNTATDYQTIGFPSGEVFDGVDDSLIAASGGGSTTKFFWCGAIQCKKVGTAQTLFSDTGTNTGYRVRINASNQLELSAGNGTAFTTVATAGTLAIGQRAVLTAWHDGASLKVQIDNGTVATSAFSTATAGTAQFTMGKDNNASSSFFGGWIYEKVYLKNDVPSDAEIASTKQYMAEAAGVTL